MLIRWGADASARPVTWDARQVENSHILLIGRSGAGNTTLLNHLLAQIQASMGGVRMHVFDVRGDIQVPGSSDVLFWENAPWGINPFEIDPDPHRGGVRRAVDQFLRLVGDATWSLGKNQRACIRRLLLDLYSRHGFNDTNPATWSIDGRGALAFDPAPGRIYLNVPFSEKDDAKALGAQFRRVRCRRRSNIDPPCRSNTDPGMDVGRVTANCGQV